MAPSVNSSFCYYEEVRCSYKNLWLGSHGVFCPELNFPKLATNLNVFALAQQASTAFAECPKLEFLALYVLEQAQNNCRLGAVFALYSTYPDLQCFHGKWCFRLLNDLNLRLYRAFNRFFLLFFAFLMRFIIRLLMIFRVTLVLDFVFLALRITFFLFFVGMLRLFLRLFFITLIYLDLDLFYHKRLFRYRENI